MVLRAVALLLAPVGINRLLAYAIHLSVFLKPLLMTAYIQLSRVGRRGCSRSALGVVPRHVFRSFRWRCCDAVLELRYREHLFASFQSANRH